MNTIETQPVIEARGIRRIFTSAAGETVALGGVDLTARPGELVMVRGRSGSGKTTLLNILGGLDQATSGSVVIAGTPLHSLDEQGLVELRRRRLGFVFQSFGLIPVLSAAENVEIPLRIQRIPTAERERRVAEALAVVGLEGHAAQRPYELSGGQQQRVGIARALVAEPEVLIADEPTGQLDSATAETMMDLFRTITRERGVAAVISTHDPLMATRADRVVELHDGLVVAPLSRDATTRRVEGLRPT